MTISAPTASSDLPLDRAPARKRITGGCRALVASCLAGSVGMGLLGGGVMLAQTDPQPRLLVAPMVGNLDDCLLQDSTSAALPAAFRPRPSSCNGEQGSAAELLEQTLSPLARESGRALRLGYTLNVPLLRLLEPSGEQSPLAQVSSGLAWQPSESKIARFVRTLEQLDRPAILYLFATHFGVNSEAEAALMQDKDNLAQTQKGTLSADTYLDYRIYPWSVARADNGITRARVRVIGEVARQICASPRALARVEGVSLLGEVHQLYPHFETGMGYESPYVITDYSPASIDAFQRALARQFGRIERLNAHLGSRFGSFSEVQPPAKDIRQGRLSHYFEHLDAFAHGQVPVSGWVRLPQVDSPDVAVVEQLQQRPWVQVRLNGVLVAREQASLSRQDVAQAHPLWRTADLGWRHDLAFAHLPTGTHRIDVLLELPDGQLANLATRQVHVLDATRAAPMPQPMVQPLPVTVPLPKDASAYVDWPRDALDLYYNPLAELWHAFRARQITMYLNGMRHALAQTCLAQKPAYVHQLYPYGNPGWDSSRYALDDVLKPRSGWRVGVSLYGESAYGIRLGQYAQAMHWQTYGITEFHPMRPLTGTQMSHVLAMHRAQGARFLSFFMEAHPTGSEPQRMHNVFSFDSHNPEHGSDALFRAVKEAFELDSVMP